MTAPADVDRPVAGELADCYVPIPMAWRLVTVGDAFAAPDGATWLVIEHEPAAAGVRVRLATAGRDWRGTVDPDELVSILVAVPERDAVGLARAELGARVIARRGAST